MKQYGRPRFMGPKGLMNLCCGNGYQKGKRYCHCNDAASSERVWRKRARRINWREWL